MGHGKMITNLFNRSLDLFKLRDAVNRILIRYFYFLNSDIKIRNDLFRSSGVPDSLPLPPPHLAYLVAGHFDQERFFKDGLLGAKCIQSILETNNLEIDTFDTVLDFGCGCGRILRHWQKLNGPKFYGCDYNRRLVKWDNETLSFADIRLNGEASRLDFEDNKFSFIYAISVFTHMREEVQNFWVEELTRILSPGGYLLITVHGTTRLHEMSFLERQRFDDGQLVLRNEFHSGENKCAAFHPERYVREKLCRNLKVVDFIPGGAKDANQDAFLLQKPD